jgi:hypothetical protein
LLREHFVFHGLSTSSNCRNPPRHEWTGGRKPERFHDGDIPVGGAEQCSTAKCSYSVAAFGADRRFEVGELEEAGLLCGDRDEPNTRCRAKGEMEIAASVHVHKNLLVPSTRYSGSPSRETFNNCLRTLMDAEQEKRLALHSRRRLLSRSLE